MQKVFYLICFALLLVGCQPAQQPAPPPQPAEPVIEYHPFSGQAPLSDAVRVGNMLYLAGKLGTVPGEGLVEGGIQPETRQTMENIKAALERYGSSMERVVKCTVFLADMAEWGAMNEVYATYFPNNKPARSAVGVSGLAINARVEIECMATLNP